MIVLDTHAFAWLMLAPSELSQAAARAIRASVKSGGIAVASVTLWELAAMVARGRIVPNALPEAWITDLVARSGVTVKEITPAIATLAAQFPEPFPGDPADRLIAATARADGIPLVTRDRQLRRSADVHTIW
ncbi:MAG TPA: type II toxin-antitoxin system VapC family toxin [Methylomirabilota bacterium]|jgi:PIN domain nuclease of toxin-antitoxin system|nr:type II toxin-antitoxin system VapC family toxin [Methylomirabilota bacterium]